MKVAGVLGVVSAVQAASYEGTVIDDNPLVVIYFENWSGWLRNYGPSVLENTLLSRPDMPLRNIVINYAFFALNPKECSVVPTDTVDVTQKDPTGYPGTDWNVGTDAQDDSLPPGGLMAAMISVKARYPYVKLIPSIGGWSRSSPFRDCMADTSMHEHMALSISDWIKVFAFDGVDFDWEYPNCENSDCGCQNEDVCEGELSNKAGAGDWDNYKAFLVHLRSHFDDLEEVMNKKLYISAAVGMNPKLIDGGNDTWQEAMPVEWMCDEDYLDYINLMAYDFYGPWDKRTGPNAPLYSNPDVEDVPVSEQMSIDDSVKRIVERCSKPYKLVLGLPTYGKTWRGVPATGDVPGLWQISDPVNGRPVKGPGTWEMGTISIWDIIDYVKYSEYCTRTWDDVSKTPTIYCTEMPENLYANELNNGEEPSERNGAKVFISYDDAESWSIKMEYAKKKGLAGAIIWAASDFGPYIDADRKGHVEEMINGLIRGWTGNSTYHVNQPRDTYSFSGGVRWEHYPCPIPGQNYMNSYETVDTSMCPPVNSDAYHASSDYVSRYAMPTIEWSAMGKDKKLIHPYTTDETPTNVPETTATQATAADRTAAPDTGNSNGRTADDTATTGAVNGGTATGGGECAAGDIVEDCEAAMAAVGGKWVESCKAMCSYHDWLHYQYCDSDIETGEQLVACIQAREPGLCA